MSRHWWTVSATQQMTAGDSPFVTGYVIDASILVDWLLRASRGEQVAALWVTPTTSSPPERILVETLSALHRRPGLRIADTCLGRWAGLGMIGRSVTRCAS